MPQTIATTKVRTLGIVLATGVLSALVSAAAGPAVASDAAVVASATGVSDSYLPRTDGVLAQRPRHYARRLQTPRTPKVGTTTAPAPAEVTAAAVEVVPGQDLAALVAGHPEGTAFLLRAGVHRLQAVTPKNGNTFTGEAGTVLSGARLLSGFTASDGAWFVDGQTQEGYRQGECRAATPLCNHPDRVFVDDLPLTPVAARDQLRAGTYFFDYAADRIWLGSDPSNHRVEAAVARAAFGGPATGVTIRSLVVEKYASPGQRGAIDVQDGTGWLVEDVVARRNAGAGLRAGQATTIRRCTVVDNGQIGIVGVGTGIVVQDNEIARNNTAGFEPGWEAGGTKFALTDGLLVQGNRVHHNDGPGLWTDVDNLRTTYLNNVVEDNAGEGIFHEISGSAVISGNTVRRNGRSGNPWVWGAGIHVASSFEVQVFGNLVEGNGNGIVGSQQNRGSGPNGERLLRDLDVHDNVVRESGLVGVGQDVAQREIFVDRRIRFQANSYASTQVFTWMDEHIGLSRWLTYGHDVP